MFLGLSPARPPSQERCGPWAPASLAALDLELAGTAEAAQVDPQIRSLLSLIADKTNFSFVRFKP